MAAHVACLNRGTLQDISCALTVCLPVSHGRCRYEMGWARKGLRKTGAWGTPSWHSGRKADGASVRPVPRGRALCTLAGLAPPRSSANPWPYAQVQFVLNQVAAANQPRKFYIQGDIEQCKRSFPKDVEFTEEIIEEIESSVGLLRAVSSLEQTRYYVREQKLVGDVVIEKCGMPVSPFVLQCVDGTVTGFLSNLCWDTRNSLPVGGGEMQHKVPHRVAHDGWRGMMKATPPPPQKKKAMSRKKLPGGGCGKRSNCVSQPLWGHLVPKNLLGVHRRCVRRTDPPVDPHQGAGHHALLATRNYQRAQKDNRTCEHPGRHPHKQTRPMEAQVFQTPWFGGALLLDGTNTQQGQVAGCT